MLAGAIPKLRPIVILPTMTMATPMLDTIAVSTSGTSAGGVRWCAAAWRPDERQRRQDRRRQRSIDGLRAPAAHDGQDDDERFAGQEQQPGEAAGQDEVVPDVLRQQDEQRADEGVREQIAEHLAIDPPQLADLQRPMRRPLQVSRPGSRPRSHDGRRRGSSSSRVIDRLDPAIAAERGDLIDQIAGMTRAQRPLDRVVVPALQVRDHHLVELQIAARGSSARRSA